MHKIVLSSTSAPAAVGPYSQAVRVGELLFCSGQIPIDPVTGKLIESRQVADQTRRVLLNLQALLADHGIGLERVVKTTVFLTDLAHFSEMNTVYGEFFRTDPPARSTVAVAALPLGALVEIEAVVSLA